MLAESSFLGPWTVDVRQEGRSQRSAPQRRHTAHPRDGETERLGRGRRKTPRPPWGECAPQAPGHLSGWNLGRAQNAGPTESVPLWSTREPEPKRLRPGNCTHPRARSRQFPCRATWSLSSVDRESTHAVSGGKPSVAQTLQALPTHASDICLQGSFLPTTQLNK